MTIETHNANPAKTIKPRRWFRFRLRTLLVMVTLLSVTLGWVGWELDQRRREKVVVNWVGEMGGTVGFPSNSPNDKRSWWEKTKDKWFGERVRYVELASENVSNVSRLVDLKKLKELWLNSEVSDLTPLKEMRNLETLYLSNWRVCEERVEEFRLALPNCKIHLSDY